MLPFLSTFSGNHLIVLFSVFLFLGVKSNYFICIDSLKFVVTEVTGVFVTATTSRVDISHDGVGNLFDFLHLFVIVFLIGFRVFVHPVNSFIDHVLQFLLVLSGDVVSNTLFVILEVVLEVVQVRFQTVSGIDTFLDLLIFLGVLLGFVNHAFDFFIRKTSLFSSNGDLFGLSGSLIFGRNLQNTVGINFESNFDLRNSTRGRRDSGQFELSEVVAILGHGSFSFVDLDHDNTLVILVGRESFCQTGGGKMESAMVNYSQ
mmetsp:Transcript_13992/g.32633  ORF Transcript_13992/g.32633 Transcript_13992/m.32633 type:complete len:260 (-) Transcript_13992:62-841(-)